MPALRLYSAAARAGNSGDATLSITLAKQALVLDTSFASAWSALYVAYSNSGEVQLASDAATHAYAPRDRLFTPRMLRRQHQRLRMLRTEHTKMSPVRCQYLTNTKSLRRRQYRCINKTQR